MNEAEQIMKRCQAGTRSYEEANNLHAACYGMIGKLLAQRKPLTVDEAISAVSSVLPVPSTGGQTHQLQIQYKYALEIARAVEAAHDIKESK
jgi:organic hydroperoxide reductase OsmC/OhrA